MSSSGKHIQSKRSDYGVQRYPAAAEDFTIANIRAGIPREMFKQNTVKSVGYMLRDFAQVALFHYVMSSWIAPALEASSFIPGGILGYLISFAVWNAFWFFQGLNFTALWVLAHEAGHGGFSDSKTINELVGFVLHSALLVPYHSWRVTHATHHKYTNHLTLDTVFVPTKLPEPLKEAIAEAPVISTIQFFGMLLAGWPAYLGFNVASQKYDGKRTNHFEPSSPIFKKSDKWGVIVSDIGLLVVLAVIGIALKQVGLWSVFAYYVVPYLWTNAWLVYITFMQHHDLRIPYYTEENFNFVRGALCSVDRDYGFCNAWLHHINDSHVVHHLFSDMPFYNAIEVTRKYVKPILGDLYASDKRSIYTQTVENWNKCLYVVPSEGITYFRH